ncbi:MAG: xanthine dehydrogenase family protein subunit M [Vicinamibacterales bacterium]
MLPNFTHVRAGSVAEAVRQLASPGARVHAGGTDLLGCLRDGVFQADKVVSLSGIKTLRGITATAAGFRVGALTTISEIASHEPFRKDYTALAQAASEVASPQLRNQGTIGGNICQRPRCWYFRGDFHCLRKGGGQCFAVQGQSQNHCIFGGNGCYIVHPSDTAPALVALGARIRITGPAGFRTVPAASFFLLPERSVTKENVLERGEIVTEILLPPPDASLRSSYRKVRGRGSWDFALASVALAITSKDGVVGTARVVLGGAAPVPWRAAGAEKALIGQQLTPEVAARAAQAAVSGAEPMEQNGYKVAMFKGLVEQSLMALATRI